MRPDFITPRECRDINNQMLNTEWVLYNPINDTIIIGTGYLVEVFEAKGFLVLGLL